MEYGHSSTVPTAGAAGPRARAARLRPVQGWRRWRRPPRHADFWSTWQGRESTRRTKTDGIRLAVGQRGVPTGERGSTHVRSRSSFSCMFRTASADSSCSFSPRIVSADLAGAQLAGSAAGPLSPPCRMARRARARVVCVCAAGEAAPFSCGLLHRTPARRLGPPNRLGGQCVCFLQSTRPRTPSAPSTHGSPPRAPRLPRGAR